MGRVKVEVDNAIKTFGLTNKDIAPLDNNTGEKLYRQLLEYFVKSGDRRWWWEDFKHESFLFIYRERPYELLKEVIPKKVEKVWLMVEDDEESFYPIYDTRPNIIKDILDQCFGFEYYIIDKKMDWLICENHHNLLIGIGEKLRSINRDKIAD